MLARRIFWSRKLLYTLLVAIDIFPTFKGGGFTVKFGKRKETIVIQKLSICKRFEDE